MAESSRGAVRAPRTFGRLARIGRVKNLKSKASGLGVGARLALSTSHWSERRPLDYHSGEREIAPNIRAFC